MLPVLGQNCLVYLLTVHKGKRKQPFPAISGLAPKIGCGVQGPCDVPKTGLVVSEMLDRNISDTV